MRGGCGRALVTGITFKWQVDTLCAAVSENVTRLEMLTSVRRRSAQGTSKGHLTRSSCGRRALSCNVSCMRMQLHLHSHLKFEI